LSKCFSVDRVWTALRPVDIDNRVTHDARDGRLAARMVAVVEMPALMADTVALASGSTPRSVTYWEASPPMPKSSCS
jgi:hypothetical protein